MPTPPPKPGGVRPSGGALREAAPILSGDVGVSGWSRGLHSPFEQLTQLPAYFAEHLPTSSPWTSGCDRRKWALRPDGPGFKSTLSHANLVNTGGIPDSASGPISSSSKRREWRLLSEGELEPGRGHPAGIQELTLGGDTGLEVAMTKARTAAANSRVLTTCRVTDKRYLVGTCPGEGACMAAGHAPSGCGESLPRDFAVALRRKALVSMATEGAGGSGVDRGQGQGRRGCQRERTGEATVARVAEGGRPGPVLSPVQAGHRSCPWLLGQRACGNRRPGDSSWGAVDGREGWCRGCRVG